MTEFADSDGIRNGDGIYDFLQFILNKGSIWVPDQNPVVDLVKEPFLVAFDGLLSVVLSLEISQCKSVGSTSL